MTLNQNDRTPDFRLNANHIRCDVKNCAYHTENDCCHADTIHVQSCTSTDCCNSQDDTACKTFRERQ